MEREDIFSMETVEEVEELVRQWSNETGIDSIDDINPRELANIANPLFYYFNLTKLVACPGTEKEDECFYRRPNREGI
jgi:hypothetical protein